MYACMYLCMYVRRFYIISLTSGKGRRAKTSTQVINTADSVILGYLKSSGLSLTTLKCTKFTWSRYSKCTRAMKSKSDRKLRKTVHDFLSVPRHLLSWSMIRRYKNKGSIVTATTNDSATNLRHNDPAALQKDTTN